MIWHDILWYNILHIHRYLSAPHFMKQECFPRMKASVLRRSFHALTCDLDVHSYFLDTTSLLPDLASSRWFKELEVWVLWRTEDLSYSCVGENWQFRDVHLSLFLFLFLYFLFQTSWVYPIYKWRTKHDY